MQALIEPAPDHVAANNADGGEVGRHLQVGCQRHLYADQRKYQTLRGQTDAEAYQHVDGRLVEGAQFGSFGLRVQLGQQFQRIIYAQIVFA